VDEVFELLARLRREGTTILLVEQAATRAAELADRVYVMSSGVVRQEQSSEDAVRDLFHISRSGGAG
jgi:branched-chain amino acid transport system ATP-binding protein